MEESRRFAKAVVRAAELDPSVAMWHVPSISPKEILKRLLWGQLGRPSGWQGRVVGRLMTSANAPAHDLTLAHSRIAPGERVLEIGFGGGALAEKALASAPGVTVRGVDASDVMVKLANERLRGAVREGRAEFRLGDVSSLPYADGSFEKALSVHSIYFWGDPVADLGEVRRVLVPGGLFVVTVDPTEPMQGPAAEQAGYDRWSREALLAVLGRSGFEDTDSESVTDLGLLCAWGCRPRS